MNVVMQDVLEALASPRRREILRLVWDGELPAGEIASHFRDVTWATISQNLRVLRETGLVTERREGNWRFYRADRRALGPLRKVLQEMWDTDLRQLRAAAAAERRRRR